MASKVIDEATPPVLRGHVADDQMTGLAAGLARQRLTTYRDLVRPTGRSAVVG